MGLGLIVALKSSVTGDSYVKILCGYVLPGLKKFPSSNDRGRPIFQQDKPDLILQTLQKHLWQKIELDEWNGPLRARS